MNSEISSEFNRSLEGRIFIDIIKTNSYFWYFQRIKKVQKMCLWCKLNRMYVVIGRCCCSSFEAAIQLHNISFVCTFQTLLQSHGYAGAVKMALFTFVISNILWFHWIHTTLVCIELCRVMTTNKLFCSHIDEILDIFDVAYVT